MAQQKKTYYTESFSLKSLLQIQLNIPKKYNSKDYWGGCMRIQEEQTTAFLNDFVNDIAIVLPEHYEILENLLYVLRSSGYKPIKKLLPHAIRKYEIMRYALRERQIAANSVKPTNLNSSDNNKFSIIENKKKMMMMSCSDLCVLGDAINAEKKFNTTKIKSKFYAFVSYRIELVLMGKMPIDPDFKVLLKKYGTSHQINLYEKIISNRVASHTPVQMQPVKQTKTKSQPKPAAKSKMHPVKKSVPPKQQPETAQPTVKKSRTGFFKKIGQSVTKVFNKVKKPLLIGGLFALSFFGGKRAYDAVVEESNGYTKTELYTNHTTPVQQSPALNVTDSLHVNNTQNVRNNNEIATSPVTNDVMKKTVEQLHKLKANNPTDRNMDVTQTANRLYQKFGNDAYKVVLVSAMTPYALNDCTKFDLRPTTHNMIEYLTTHELTPLQRNALDIFIAQHVRNNSINMNDFAAYNVNQLMQNQR